MTVVTLTLNPAIDQTVMLDRLLRGEVHRAQSVRRDAGGKGINVASCLADWGVPVTACGILGADNPAAFDALFAAKPITDRLVRVAGETRTNIKLVDAGETTDINLPGPVVPPAALAEVERTLAEAATPGTLVIAAGSLPPGCAPDHYATLAATLSARGARLLLDASGVALTAALEGPAAPYAIKPNRRELADWRGRPLDRIADVAAEARALHARGIALVVVSMGAEGALFLSAEGALVARLPAGALASTVGAGDAMVAGIAAALKEGAGLERIARLGTAFAVAKLGRPGPNLPERGTVNALAHDVTITDAGEQA
ncbi:1-phosphofructokinase [Sphingomonas solaris]|uniref:Phosphofructokinase n=1 Tax=Alterirhizorhabdus solaris TaxID=2529389 RepID=A0A558R731_9SPHN|nr:1-phosphofructokinase [Sphingomonas solaris]TVV75132.1 1-phosphofructokinase [Sphingomonas solaris]